MNDIKDVASILHKVKCGIEFSHEHKTEFYIEPNMVPNFELIKNVFRVGTGLRTPLKMWVKYLKSTDVVHMNLGELCGPI